MEAKKAGKVQLQDMVMMAIRNEWKPRHNPLGVLHGGDEVRLQAEMCKKDALCLEAEVLGKAWAQKNVLEGAVAQMKCWLSEVEAALVQSTLSSGVTAKDTEWKLAGWLSNCGSLALALAMVSSFFLLASR